MFVFCWSLISPLCLGIVVGSLSLSQKYWCIGDSNIGLSIVVYVGLGSLLLGTAQFRIVRSHYLDPTTPNYRNPLWFVISLMSWIMGFGGIYISFNNLWIVPLFLMASTALKGGFIDKYLVGNFAGEPT
jgi:hypothetical protein